MSLSELSTSSPHPLPAAGGSHSGVRAHEVLRDRFDSKQGSLYLRIVAAIEDAIEVGDLQPGDQIPPQRMLAATLGVDFTTVTRAYSTARVRGLIEGAVGRGTFVRAPTRPTDAGLLQLTPNRPPPPTSLSLSQVMRDTAQLIIDRTDLGTLLASQSGQAPFAQRLAGTRWVQPMLGDITPDRILITAGAQSALHAILVSIAAPGDTIAVSTLTYPGLIALANRLRLRLIACPEDDLGLIPEALAELLARERPRALYCAPTLHPGSALTIPASRREDVALACRQANVIVIEDDAFGRVPSAPVLAISAQIPERSIYISSVSKAISPGLKQAYVVAPDAGAADCLGRTFAVLEAHASPLTAAIITTWIRDGSIDSVLDAVRQETAHRRSIAAALLPRAVGAADSYHVWLDLPRGADHAGLLQQARAKGVLLASSKSHAAGPGAPEGLCISLGTAPTRSDLQKALRTLAGLGLSAAPSLARAYA